MLVTKSLKRTQKGWEGLAYKESQQLTHIYAQLSLICTKELLKMQDVKYKMKDLTQNAELKCKLESKMRDAKYRWLKMQ